MLLGTTFAWFTDSVTSGNNVIQSGNLDMVVEYKTSLDDEWVALEKDTKLFNQNALFEPGYTEVVFLRVANAGNLAFKYNLALSVEDSVIGKSVLGNDIELSKYLDMGIYVQDEYSSGFNYAEILLPNMFADRATALNNVKNSVTKLNNKNDEGLVVLASDCPVLVGEQTSQVIALVLTMPTTVGNEANHIGTEAPQINLGLHVVATQYMSESDDFGADYDKDATYPGIENSDAPKAEVTTLPVNERPTEINYTWSPVKDEGFTPQTLDVAYKFSTTESKDEALAGDYSEWHADFYVYANNNVPAKSIALAGQYGAWDWLGFTNHVDVIEPVRLLKDVKGLAISYKEICDFETFYCGATAIDAEALKGTIMTVELRLYEATGGSLDTETGNYVVIGTYTHTF